MRIETTCPRCGVKAKAPATFAGRNVRCPKCGRVFAAPTVERSTEETSPGFERSRMLKEQLFPAKNEAPLDTALSGINEKRMNTIPSKSRYPELRKEIDRIRRKARVYVAVAWGFSMLGVAISYVYTTNLRIAAERLQIDIEENTRNAVAILENIREDIESCQS